MAADAKRGLSRFGNMETCHSFHPAILTDQASKSEDACAAVEDLLIRMRRALAQSTEKILQDFSKTICEAVARSAEISLKDVALPTPSASTIEMGPGCRAGHLLAQPLDVLQDLTPLPGQATVVESTHGSSQLRFLEDSACGVAGHHIRDEMTSMQALRQDSAVTLEGLRDENPVKDILQLGSDSDANTDISVDHPTSACRQTFEQRVRTMHFENKALKPCNSVHDLYNESLCSRIASSQIFEYATLAVITANAGWIAYDTDENKEDFLLDADWQFQVAEHFFCVYFSIEWLIRFQAFESKLQGFKSDHWFLFDTVLVSAMVLETWILSIVLLIVGTDKFSFGGGGLGVLRLFRLARLGRLTRLIRAVPELAILCKGMTGALRSVLFTLCFLILIVFLFAIALTQLTENTAVGEEYFDGVGAAMVSLMIDGTLPDQAKIIRDGLDHSWWLGVLILLFVLLASLTVLNMLVGVLCDVVSQTSRSEKTNADIDFLKSQMETMLEVDLNCDNLISKDEFHALMQKDEAVQTLIEVGVNLEGLLACEEFIFKNGECITFPEFLDLILDFRGENQATVKDIIDLKRQFGMEMQRIRRTLCELLPRLDKNIQPPPPVLAWEADKFEFRRMDSDETV